MKGAGEAAESCFLGAFLPLPAFYIFQDFFKQI